MKTLLIPIHLDALHLESPMAVAGALADFSRLPWYDGVRDRNPDSPFLAEAVISEPFQNDTLTLQAGIHLHWSLPDALNRSVQGAQGRDFPAVPNRWLVRRIDDQGVVARWVVESDYLWPRNATAPAGTITVPIPLDRRHPHRQPFRYMGRQLTLEDWRQDAGQGTYWKDFFGKPLTAVGYGHPAFDAFYPSSSTVFGFFDPEFAGDVRSELRYDLVGWYDDSRDDYLLDRIEAIKTRPGPGGKKIGDDPKQILAALAAELGWTFDADQPPAGMVCFGRIRLTSDSHKPRPLESPDAVSVGPAPIRSIRSSSKRFWRNRPSCRHGCGKRPSAVWRPTTTATSWTTSPPPS